MPFLSTPFLSINILPYQRDPYIRVHDLVLLVDVDQEEQLKCHLDDGRRLVDTSDRLKYPSSHFQCLSNNLDKLVIPPEDVDHEPFLIIRSVC